MTGILRIFRGVAMIGLGNVVGALIYGRRRDRLEAAQRAGRSGGPGIQAQGPAYAEPPRVPGALREAASVASGARFHFQSSDLLVRFLAPDLAFLGWDGADMQPSWAVGNTSLQDVRASLERAEGAWRLSSPALKVDVLDGGTVRIHDAGGMFLREDGPPEWLGEGWSQTIRLPDDAGLYGLGFRFASFDLRQGAGKDRPRSFRFWNSDPSGYGPDDDPLYLSIPVYMCAGDAGCHLAFHDTTFDGTLTFGSEAVLRFQGGPCRTYVAAGTPARALELYTTLTGRPPLPPLWALGYQHSRWGFRTQAELRRVYEGFLSRGLPLSALYMDIDQLRGNRTMTVDQRTHPDLPAFAEEISRHGVHLIAITNPGVKRERGFSLYDEGSREDVFVKEPGGREALGVVWSGWSAFPDFTSAGVRRWWGRQYVRQLANGISGFWHDMNEPTSFVPAGEPTLPLCVRHDMEGRGGDHKEAHNVYGLLMNRAGYEGLRSLRPELRPFIVSRSGWAGMQKWSWTWTGDVETSWECLRRTVRAVLGLGLCGVPYTGPDIGGFTMTPDAELYVRWFQLSSFLPFFRTHCAIHLPPREPWSFGPEALETVRAFLKSRYKMLPYWYTCAHESSLSGAPLVRPVFWDVPARSDLRGVDDEFLLGDDILVAPVLDKGARSREVVLPSGSWFPLAEGGPREGRFTYDAPLSAMPVFAKAGSLIPMTGGGGLELHAYPGMEGEARGALYSDAGDGYGESRVDTFVLAPAGGGSFKLSKSAAGGFSWPYGYVTLVLHGFPGSVGVRGDFPFTVALAPSE